MRDRLKTVIRYSGITVWIVFTVSLTVWWLIFALRQLDTIKELDIATGARLAAHHRMLIWEGATLLVCVIGGGAALLYDAYRELRLVRRLRLFFLTFAHEIKTPLASLRLQAESLAEDLRHTPSERLVDRLVADTNRLTMRIENSLFYTNLENPVFCYEEIKLSETLESCRRLWPGIEIGLGAEALLIVDRRALEAILNNLIQNAILHGRASKLSVNARQPESEKVLVEVADLGEGFHGSSDSLGELFSRPSARSGSGLGLFLCRELVHKMNGRFEILQVNSGFAVQFSLRGKVL